MIKVGDRVTVIGRSNYGIDCIGRTGSIAKAWDDGDVKVVIDGAIYLKNGKLAPYDHIVISTEDLKLITKGDDMEIEVGQVWECVESINGLKPKDSIIITEKKPRKGFTQWYGEINKGNKTFITDNIGYLLNNFELITNIEGVKKMTKAKGIKLKLGMEVKNNGYEGKILYISPQQTVFDCNGTHRSCKTDDLEIVFQLPTEPLNPKAPKKTKKKKK
jgi:hypothetical protein